MLDHGLACALLVLRLGADHTSEQIFGLGGEQCVTDELTQGVKDAAARFKTPAWAPTATRRRIRCSRNCGRRRRCIRAGPRWASSSNPEEGQQTFTAYTFDAVKAVFTDNKTFSTRCYEAIVRPLQGPTILEMQEPEHAVYRKLHEFAFARSSMRRWEAELVRPLVERTVERLKDAKHADLVEEVFMPIPVRVIAALIGLPDADSVNSTAWQSTCSDSTRDMDSALSASAQMKEYFVGILADRRRDRTDDMVTVLAEADIDGVRMSDEQIYGFMRNSARRRRDHVAVHGQSRVRAPTHPDQLAAVVADRSLLPQAIEEGIRWETPLLNFMREITCDIEFHGVRRFPRARRWRSTSAAPITTRPDGTIRRSFDIFRERKPHIGFAHGAHVCLGMHLARLETTMIFNTLVRRLPRAAARPRRARPRIRPGRMFRSPQHLKVVWD